VPTAAHPTRFFPAVTATAAPSSVADGSKSGLFPAIRRAKGVLVVEPNEAVRATIVAALVRRYFVHEAASAVAAAELLGRIQAPELIICSIRLPDFGGELLARRLRQFPALARIPFIFLTEERAVHEQLLALGAGAKACVEKPVKLEELSKKVDRLIA
jgi:CheY-like chemotaxis protein